MRKFSNEPTMTLTQPKISNKTWLLCGQPTSNEPVRMFPVDHSPFTIGRRSGTSLTLSCSSVSGNHAELTIDEGQLSIRDLGSTNGTFINGDRIDSEPYQLKHDDLVQIALTVFRVKLKENVYDSSTVPRDGANRALSLIQFDKLMTERAVAPHFQPIVDIATKRAIGYEVLGRSSLTGLRTPKDMFDSAAALAQEAELSRMLRFEGIAQSAVIPGEPQLFVNTHPAEMSKPERLIQSLQRLREAAPDTKLVLEIHEGGVTRLDHMRDLRKALNEIGVGLAYDDFGAGQARLVELVEVPPDYLKFDIVLVRDLHLASEERKGMLRKLVQMTRDLGIATIAEGIESPEEHVACQDIGFDFVQGFLYGRPALPATFLE